MHFCLLGKEMAVVHLCFVYYFYSPTWCNVLMERMAKTKVLVVIEL